MSSNKVVVGMDTLRKVKSALGEMRSKVKVIGKKHYTASQYAYFSAVFCLIIGIAFSTEFELWMNAAGVFAFFGMLRELLSLFRKLWHTILGKSLIVVTYASLTNLAFAFAAVKINDVTGIEPFPFTYTLGFTTFILMPFWLVISSTILLSLTIMIANVWMLFRLCLKVIGIRLKMHWEDENLAVLTMFFRIGLIPLVMVVVLSVIEPYLPSMNSKRMSSIDIGTGLINLKSEISAELANETNDDELAKNLLDDEVLNESAVDKSLQIERLIAGFIWSLESYYNSVCQKRDDQKSVIIDDYSVLLISKDKEEALGYKFEVNECIAVYKERSDLSLIHI